MKNNLIPIARLFVITVCISLLFLWLPDSTVRKLLYDAFPTWTWVLAISLRVVALQTTLLAIYRYFKSDRSSPLVYTGLACFIAFMFAEATLTTRFQSALKLESLLFYSGIIFITVELARQRKRDNYRQPSNYKDNEKRTHQNHQGQSSVKGLTKK
jgi:hypothetical protein